MKAVDDRAAVSQALLWTRASTGATASTVLATRFIRDVQVAAASLRRPVVLVVEAAQNRGHHDASAEICAAGPFQLAQDPLLYPLMWSALVEMCHPLGEHSSEVTLSENL